ncbi:MAG: DNA polymerase III subunit delta [Verrucomicrobiota bacterium]
MPPAALPAGPVLLVCGDDDFQVKQRARVVFDAWCEAAGGMDHESIDAAAGNAGEALQALGRLREALNTLPFFGGSKVVWFQNCNFLGEDRTATAAAVTEALGGFAEELKRFRWEGVRLLVSATKPDKRRSFYKALEKLGGVEAFAALSADDKDGTGKAEADALRLFQAAGKDIEDEALAELVTRTGPNLRQLSGETEKLIVYSGPRRQVTLADVQRLTTRHRQARAFALAEALGDRDLPRLLRTLDEELWEMRVDRKKSGIGLLYGLLSKIRCILLLKELRKAGVLRPTRDYSSFKGQLERVSTGSLPADRRFNPLAAHPFTLFQAMRQTDHYETAELVRAMELLLEANRKLVSSDLDDALVLQQVLVDITGLPARRRAPAS